MIISDATITFKKNGKDIFSLEEAFELAGFSVEQSGDAESTEQIVSAYGLSWNMFTDDDTGTKEGADGVETVTMMTSDGGNQYNYGDVQNHVAAVESMMEFLREKGFYASVEDPTDRDQDDGDQDDDAEIDDSVQAAKIVDRLLEDEEPQMTKEEVLDILSKVSPSASGHNMSFIEALNKHTDNQMIRANSSWVYQIFKSVVDKVKNGNLSQNELWDIYDDFGRFADP